MFLSLLKLTQITGYELDRVRVVLFQYLSLRLCCSIKQACKNPYAIANFFRPGLICLMTLMHSTFVSLQICTVQLSLYRCEQYNCLFTNMHSTIVSLQTCTVQLSLYAHARYNCLFINMHSTVVSLQTCTVQFLFTHLHSTTVSLRTCTVQLPLRTCTVHFLAIR